MACRDVFNQVSISISMLHFTAVLSNLTNSNNMQQLTAYPEVFQMPNKKLFSASLVILQVTAIATLKQ
jgi:hypothetical protein